MPETDQDKLKEMLDSEGWRMVLRMMREIKKGHLKRCLNQSSPCAVMMDAKSRYDEIDKMMLRIGELANIQNYNPIE